MSGLWVTNIIVRPCACSFWNKTSISNDVRQYHGRVVYQCPCYGHTLHLSARHLVGTVVKPVAKTYCLQGGDGSLAALFGADAGVVHQWQFNVLNARGLRKQVVVLENEPYLAVAEHCALWL